MHIRRALVTAYPFKPSSGKATPSLPQLEAAGHVFPVSSCCLSLNYETLLGAHIPMLVAAAERRCSSRCKRIVLRCKRPDHRTVITAASCVRCSSNGSAVQYAAGDGRGEWGG